MAEDNKDADNEIVASIRERASAAIDNARSAFEDAQAEVQRIIDEHESNEDKEVQAAVDELNDLTTELEQLDNEMLSIGIKAASIGKENPLGDDEEHDEPEHDEP